MIAAAKTVRNLRRHDRRKLPLRFVEGACRFAAGSYLVNRVSLLPIPRRASFSAQTPPAAPPQGQVA
jgi:hypothetical protein